MPDPTLFILAGCGLALGAIVSQLRGPTCWSWQGRAGDLHRRLSCLPRGAPPVVRRAAGMAVLAALLAGGALTAYAAAPSGPDALPSEVVGVVGSGSQLSLKVAQDQKIRTVKLGEDYRDGWKLDALTSSTATLSKDGERREIGLNPTGALGETAPKGDPSKVEIAGDTIEARQATEKSIVSDYWAATGRTDKSLDLDEMARVLGPARLQAFLDNDKRLGELLGAKARADALARGDFNTVRYLDGLSVAGPDTFFVPPGDGVDRINDAAKAIGLPSRMGYGIDLEASSGGGLVMVKCHTPTTPTRTSACG